MVETWTSIKEYAEKKGVTIQAVYQQINRKQNKDFISQHSRKINGIKYLDDEAVAYLESKRENSPTVVIQTDDKERMEELERQNEMLKAKVMELQELVIAKSDKIEQLQDILLLEQKKEVPEEVHKKPWWKFWE